MEPILQITDELVERSGAGRGDKRIPARAEVESFSCADGRCSPDRLGPEGTAVAISKWSLVTDVPPFVKTRLRSRMPWLAKQMLAAR